MCEKKAKGTKLIDEDLKKKEETNFYEKARTQGYASSFRRLKKKTWIGRASYKVQKANIDMKGAKVLRKLKKKSSLYDFHIG